MNLAKIVLSCFLAFNCGGNTKNRIDGSLDALVIISDSGNIYPKAVLLPECDEYSEDGLCVYRMGVEETRCWDLSKSHDSDGYLVKFLFDLLLDKGVYYEGPPVEKMCGGYTGSGKFQGIFTVTDDKGAEDSVNFYGIAEEKD